MPFTPWSTIPLKIRPVAKHVRSLFDRAAQEEKDHSVPRLAGFLTVRRTCLCARVCFMCHTQAKSGSYDNNWTGDLSGVSVAMYWHELVYDHPVGTPARFALLVKVSGVHERAGFNLARSISLLAQGPWGTLPTESIMRTGHAIVPDAAYAVIILTEAARSFHRGMLSDSTNIRPGRLPNTYALTYPSQDAVWKMTPLQLRNMECILEYVSPPVASRPFS